MPAPNTASDPREVLRIDPPTAQTLQGWETAESQAFRFPQRFIDKCREMNEIAKGVTLLERERDQLFDYVVRNVISTLDNIRAVSVELTATDSVTAEPVAAAENADGDTVSPESSSEGQDQLDVTANQPPPDAVNSDDMLPAAESADATMQGESDPDSSEELKLNHARRLVDSVGRSLTALLEHLGVVRVELLGQSYRSVEVNGRAIEDPFEVVESRSKGKATDLPVVEVLTDLWVRTEPGVRVVRKGQVIC